MSELGKSSKDIFPNSVVLNCPLDQLCQSHETLVTTLVPDLSLCTLLYQRWGDDTLESKVLKVSLVIPILAMFGNHESSLPHFIIDKTETQREVICLRSSGLEAKFSGSI